MNKTELVTAIATKAKITKVEAQIALDCTTAVIIEALIAKQEVFITGFGTFQSRHRAPRGGRNPVTGQPLEIQARWVPTFKPGTNLKAAVNK